MSESMPNQTFDEQLNHWGERIKLIQSSATKKTNLSIFIGIPLGILPFVLLQVVIGIAPRSANTLSCLSLCMFPLVIVLPVLLNSFWAGKSKDQEIQQLTDEILQACEANSFSKTKVGETLAATFPHSSVCAALVAKVDPERAALLQPAKAQNVRADTANPDLQTVASLKAGNDVDGLIPYACGNFSAPVQRAAQQALIEMGEPAIEPLIIGLRAGNMSARQSAARILVVLYRSKGIGGESKRLILDQRDVITQTHRDARSSHSDSQEYSSHVDCTPEVGSWHHDSPAGSSHVDRGGVHTDIDGLGINFPL